MIQPGINILNSDLINLQGRTKEKKTQQATEEEMYDQ